jgi:hypothetical protein
MWRAGKALKCRYLSPLMGLHDYVASGYSSQKESLSSKKKTVGKPTAEFREETHDGCVVLGVYAPED